MQGLNNRVRVLEIIFSATAVVVTACSPPSGEQAIADADRPAWVIVGGDVASEVAAFLEPTPGTGSRIVSSRNDRAILSVREAELDTVAGFFHERYARCGAFTTHSSLAEAEAAISQDERITSQVAESPALVVAAPEVVQQLIPLVSPTQIVSTINGLVAFGTRHYRSTGGVQAATWLRDRWATMARGRTGATATLFQHPDWPQPSVLLTIPGDQAPNEVVVIGGHLDTINRTGATSAPGADDDASGVATLT